MWPVCGRIDARWSFWYRSCEHDEPPQDAAHQPRHRSTYTLPGVEAEPGSSDYSLLFLTSLGFPLTCLDLGGDRVTLKASAP